MQEQLFPDDAEAPRSDLGCPYGCGGTGVVLVTYSGGERDWEVCTCIAPDDYHLEPPTWHTRPWENVPTGHYL